MWGRKASATGPHPIVNIEASRNEMTWRLMTTSMVQTMKVKGSRTQSYLGTSLISLEKRMLEVRMSTLRSPVTVTKHHGPTPRRLLLQRPASNSRKHIKESQPLYVQMHFHAMNTTQHQAVNTGNMLAPSSVQLPESQTDRQLQLQEAQHRSKV